MVCFGLSEGCGVHTVVVAVADCEEVELVQGADDVFIWALELCTEFMKIISLEKEMVELIQVGLAPG